MVRKGEFDNILILEKGFVPGVEEVFYHTLDYGRSLHCPMMGRVQAAVYLKVKLHYALTS